MSVTLLRRGETMKISTRGRYGLKAMVDLAVYSQNNICVNLKSIARRQDISENYLEQLIAPLKKADIVKSVRGAQGGYVLNKNPEEISVGDILRILEGPLDVVDCAASQSNSCGGRCNNCVTKNVWEKISESISVAADSITLKNLMDDYTEIIKAKS